MNTDILIIGGGSAGFGAAYRALLCSKYSVALIEKGDMLGGTSTIGGVNNWEPGVSGNGVHYEIARRLINSGKGYVAKTTLYADNERRYALSERSDDDYSATLIRHGLNDWEFRRFIYEPDAMANAMLELLKEADNGRNNLSLWLNSELMAVETNAAQISSCLVKTPKGNIKIYPKLVIDSSGDIVCARMSGCSYAIGEEAKSTYNETCAPETMSDALNGITQSFRIMPMGSDKKPKIPELYNDVDLSSWEEFMRKYNCPVSCFYAYPDGGYGVNMLPTINGEELLKYPYDELKHLCEARAHSYLGFLWEKSNLKGYEISEIFPLLGIRESYRLKGKRVLTFDEILSGGAMADDIDTTVAFADHPADTHGRGMALKPTGLYGIPYECMLPKEIDNMLVACRGASFSHLAASSARLSRTMLALGEAAGKAVCYCLDEKINPKEVKKEDMKSFLV